jgi:hypothetical protein
MNTRYLTFAMLILAMASMVVGYIIAELPWVTAIILFLGILWIVAELRGWRWPGSLILFLLVISAAIGIVVQVDPIWSILATAFALATWELSYFNRTIQNAAWVRMERLIVDRHNRRVLVATLISVLLAWVTTQIQVDFGFGIALLLAIITLFGLSRAFVFLRRSG